MKPKWLSDGEESKQRQYPWRPKIKQMWRRCVDTCLSDHKECSSVQALLCCRSTVKTAPAKHCDEKRSGKPTHARDKIHQRRWLCRRRRPPCGCSVDHHHEQDCCCSNRIDVFDSLFQRNPSKIRFYVIDSVSEHLKAFTFPLAKCIT